MSIIKEALQYINSLALGNAEVKQVGGQIFSGKELALIPEPTASTLTVRSLSGLVDYLVNNYDNWGPVLLHVESPTDVKVVSGFNRDYRRDCLIRAEALLPTIPFERFLDVENFNILLQSCFVPTVDRDSILKIVGNLKEDNVKTTGDDGVSQTVTAKTGITTVADVVLPNPAELKPFRTFIDIPQPACSFVFRMQEGPRAGLFEADGGAWKLQAMASIKEYLVENLSEEIDNDFVTIIA
ncbi:hypothetical protein ACE3MQ_25155 [Paenibacillus lentus]|uniref:hypothetical protein n=1 Tax=Paenibacillus lentus TaxID=1338368 RepID=UPI00364FFF90